MKQLQQLQEWIVEDKLTIRRPNCKVLKEIDSVLLAEKLAYMLVKISFGDKSFTTCAGTLGRLVLMGHEDLTAKKRVINKNRVDVGLQLLRITLNKKICSIYRMKEARDSYQIKVHDKDFVDQLYYYFPETGESFYAHPCLNKPEIRAQFDDGQGGELVRKINYDNVNQYSYGKIPLCYDAVNTQQQVPHLVNVPVRNVYLQLQDHDFFTNKSLNLTEEQRAGITRDNNMVMGISGTIGTNPFYVHYFLDFRSRIYQSINYFAYTGSKLAKSMYLFANKKKIGKAGLFWMKYHTANCFGQDKLSTDGRVNYTDKHLAEWLKIASDPVNDTRWMEAKDPHNFLAAIMELKAAYDCKNPLKFKSGLPIQFDCTCSGLQILSILSRDRVAGALCNLTDTDILGDYYRFIAEKAWEDDGLPEIWRKLEHIKRDIAKRPCMTVLYSAGGVTIGKTIYEDFSPKHPEITKEDCDYLGKLLVRICKKEMKGAFGLMKLFIKLGLLEAKEGRDLHVKLPYSDFPVIQTYRDDLTELTQFTINSRHIRLRFISEYSVKMVFKDIITGSSPNIVHGMDSELPKWIINNTDYDVLTNHDSFSCVAADAGKLYEDARRGLYTIFKDDVLGNLIRGLGYPELLNDIEIGDLELEEFLDNQYCIA